ncbi:hypothetical protein SKAU_G00118630 [Synaphobranchus kaupii]|uniref:Ig-like domain-containing protein n=1 Tax=Synaphobranchus kaupii TaxID=118154 RepID=A0A9Q1J014_SYNKA|nr:hypothetical protein SKAU_G00118630 [Synaphobranchus kaupii]
MFYALVTVELYRCDNAFDYWGKGTAVTVSTGVQQAPSVFPILACGSGSGGNVILGCMAKDFMPEDLTFKWTLKGGAALPDVHQYPSIQSGGKFTAVSYATVKEAEWNKQVYECSAEYQGTSTKVDFKKPITIPQKHALLYIMAPSQDQLKHNNTVTLACLATEFYPKEHTFTWRDKGKKISEGITTVPAVEMEGDKYSVTSFLRIPESQWKDMEANISCEFKHVAGDSKRTAGKTPADCTKSIVATVIPPSNEELFLNNKVVLKCKVTGNLDNIDKVEWQKIDGTPLVSTKETEGTSEMHTLLVNFDEWANGTQFTCIVWHFESGDTIRMNYKRENGNEPQPPSVFILTPSEQTSSEKVTLICYAKGFFPKEVLFSWLADDKPVERTQFQTTQVVKTGRGYSVYSQLSISAAAWERGVMYTCMVHHDAAFNTQMRTIVRTIDSLSKKATTVSLNLGLPRNCTA